MQIARVAHDRPAWLLLLRRVWRASASCPCLGAVMFLDLDGGVATAWPMASVEPPSA